MLPFTLYKIVFFRTLDRLITRAQLAGQVTVGGLPCPFSKIPSTLPYIFKIRATLVFLVKYDKKMCKETSTSPLRVQLLKYSPHILPNSYLFPIALSFSFSTNNLGWKIPLLFYQRISFSYRESRYLQHNSLHNNLFCGR